MTGIERKAGECRWLEFASRKHAERRNCDTRKENSKQGPAFHAKLITPHLMPGDALVVTIKCFRKLLLRHRLQG